ncbi:hypothetical protein [Shewanella phage SFCi1]|nr:hypothetical protein [Shewanella phage SFCi1]
MATGGSIESVGLDGRTFAVAADADSQRKLGGFTNEFQSNGDGTGRKVMTREGWMIDGLQLAIDDLRDDHEFLQDLADAKDFIVIDITYVSGAVYQGQGTITGDLQVSSQSTTGSVTLNGPGRLTKQ